VFISINIIIALIVVTFAITGVINEYIKSTRAANNVTPTTLEKPGVSEMPKNTQPNVSAPPNNIPIQPAEAGLQTVPSSLPQVASSLPQVASSLPQVASSIPQVASNIPQVASSLPQVASSLPQVASSLPQVASSLPQVQAGLMKMPQVQSVLQGLNGMFPVPPQTTSAAR